MKFFTSKFLYAAIVFASVNFANASAALYRQLDNDHTETHMELDDASKSMPSTTSTSSQRSLTLRVINQSTQQPFSPFFVMVHNDQIDPLYARGEPASVALATLAEEGDSSELLALYEGAEGVLNVFQAGILTMPGTSVEIHLTVTDEYPLVTIASMAVNTNDCFVSLNGAALESGMVLNAPGNDAGSEVNNEDCSCIPGPACAGFEKQEGNCGAGEGFVHVHRGIHGFEGSHLLQRELDWRNPMMRVVVEESA